jgi:hypothetical protein
MTVRAILQKKIVHWTHRRQREAPDDKLERAGCPHGGIDASSRLEVICSNTCNNVDLSLTYLIQVQLVSGRDVPLLLDYIDRFISGAGFLRYNYVSDSPGYTARAARAIFLRCAGVGR